jgi:CheY-like chemotaxis protein
MSATTEKTVLIVDNHLTEATRLVRQLDYVGLKAIFTATGEGALHQIAEHFPALVLLEVELSDMDGLEIVSFLRNSSKSRDVPILAMSAFPHMKDRCLQAGCNHFIQKPLKMLEVVTLIRRCLQ